MKKPVTTTTNCPHRVHRGDLPPKATITKPHRGDLPLKATITKPHRGDLPPKATIMKPHRGDLPLKATITKPCRVSRRADDLNLAVKTSKRTTSSPNDDDGVDLSLAPKVRVLPLFLPPSPTRTAREAMLLGKYASLISKSRNQLFGDIESKVCVVGKKPSIEEKRKAAREALEKVEENVEIDDNWKTMKDMQRLCLWPMQSVGGFETRWVI